MAAGTYSPGRETRPPLHQALADTGKKKTSGFGVHEGDYGQNLRGITVTPPEPNSIRTSLTGTRPSSRDTKT